MYYGKGMIDFNWVSVKLLLNSTYPKVLIIYNMNLYTVIFFILNSKSFEKVAQAGLLQGFEVLCVV